MKASKQEREGRSVPAMEAFVKIDGVFTGDDLILAALTFLHHGGCCEVWSAGESEESEGERRKEKLKGTAGGGER